MSSQITTLYKDKELTEARYPRTKVEAISNSDGVMLEDLLGDQVTYVLDGTTLNITTK